MYEYKNKLLLLLLLLLLLFLSDTLTFKFPIDHLSEIMSETYNSSAFVWIV